MRLTLTQFIIDAFQKGRIKVIQSVTKMIKKPLISLLTLTANKALLKVFSGWEI